MQRSDKERLAHELAQRLGAAIDSFNARRPRGKQIKIDANLSRILDNDPDRQRTRRSTRRRPTVDPGVFTLKQYADQLGVTIGFLLGEESLNAGLLATDIGELEEIIASALSRLRKLKHFAINVPLPAIHNEAQQEAIDDISAALLGLPVASLESTNTNESPTPPTPIAKRSGQR